MRLSAPRYGTATTAHDAQSTLARHKAGGRDAGAGHTGHTVRPSQVRVVAEDIDVASPPVPEKH